jgi:uncharacterized RDD family membrane protein YckC
MKQWGRVATIELGVVGIYVSVAGLLIEVAMGFLPIFEVPNWVLRLITLLLLLGLPATLVLAWRPISRWVDSRGGPHASQRPGFWLRFVAYFIDGVIVNIPAYIAGLMIGVLLEGASGQADKDTLQVFGNLAVVAAGWLYYALMESSPKQATLGKLALGFVVTDLQGQRISFGRATGRYFGMIVSALTLCIGFLMCAWTERKQCLHDMMAGCLMAKRWETSPNLAMELTGSAGKTKMKNQFISYHTAGSLIRLLGWIELVALVLFIIFMEIPAIAEHRFDAIDALLPLSLLLPAFQLFLGRAIQEHKNWARIIGIIFGIFLLPGLPLGTLIGAHVLWCLIKKWDASRS